MAAVVVASLMLAALRSNSFVWARATLLVTCGVLALAVATAVCRSGARRAWWLGFAVFGWGYLLLTYDDLFSQWPWLHARYCPTLPTEILTTKMESSLLANRTTRGREYEEPIPYRQVAQMLWALVCGLAGALLARVVFGASDATRDEACGRPGHARGRWSWLRPVVAAITFYGAIAGLFSWVLAWSPYYWAPGVAALTMWSVFGLAAVGAICSRARPRAAWFGAAVAGPGCLLVVFGQDPHMSNWLHLAADDLLMPARPWFRSDRQSDAKRFPRADARILQTLEERVPMRFPDPTSLESVLKHVKAATAGRHLPVFVNPAGLDRARRTMKSRVSLEVEGLPLKRSLRLILAQLGLKYTVDRRYLCITARNDWLLPSYEGPFFDVGHCFLALVAAGIGAVLGHLVRRTGNRSGE